MFDDNGLVKIMACAAWAWEILRIGAWYVVIALCGLVPIGWVLFWLWG